MPELIGTVIEEETLNSFEFYKDSLFLLEGALSTLLSKLDSMRDNRGLDTDRDPVEHFKARIKSVKSMKEKLLRHGFSITPEAAMTQVFDAAGLRVVCTFVDDVYQMADFFRSQKDLRVMEEKDYIKNPKPNGYRSYHMVVEVPVAQGNGAALIFVEVQIRTLAMDCWASLEHRLKYKHNIPNQKLIVDELKRCADEIASTDLNLQSIRDLIDVSP